LYRQGATVSTTSDRNDPRLTHGADDEPVEQAEVYLVLSEELCGTVTTMAVGIAETYAANPRFYGSTYCTWCRKHRRVGAEGEFVWLDGSKVGT
jgi:hypothetical protein